MIGYARKLCKASAFCQMHLISERILLDEHKRMPVITKTAAYLSVCKIRAERSGAVFGVVEQNIILGTSFEACSCVDIVFYSVMLKCNEKIHPS